MSEVINLSVYRQGVRLRRVRQIEPMLVEIVDALARLGGAGHRRAIADQVFAGRTGKRAPAPRAVESEIYDVLDDYAEATRRRRSPPLVHRPLGEDSYRWALTPHGADLLRRAATPRGRSGRDVLH